MPRRRTRPRQGTSPRSVRSRPRRTPRCRSPNGWWTFRSCRSPSRTSRRSPSRRCRRSWPRSPRSIPQHDRVIALDRVLASVDKSQIMPKNVEGVKADPPAVFFSKTPAVIVNIDGDPVWSPIAGTDLKYAINTNWDLFELDTVEDLLSAAQRDLAEGDEPRRRLDAGRHPSRQLQEDSGRRQLERSQGGGSGQEAVGERGAQGVRQHQARRADSAEGRAELSAGRRHVAAVGEQHRKRRVPARQRPGRSTTWSPAAGSARRTSPARGRSRRSRCPRTSRRFRWSTIARACWRRCRAPTRPPRPCSSRAFPRPRASTRNR